MRVKCRHEWIPEHVWSFVPNDSFNNLVWLNSNILVRLTMGANVTEVSHPEWSLKEKRIVF